MLVFIYRAAGLLLVTVKQSACKKQRKILFVTSADLSHHRYVDIFVLFLPLWFCCRCQTDISKIVNNFPLPRETGQPFVFSKQHSFCSIPPTTIPQHSSLSWVFLPRYLSRFDSLCIMYTDVCRGCLDDFI